MFTLSLSRLPRHRSFNLSTYLTVMDDVKKDRSTSNLDAETTHSSPECTRTEEHSAVNVTKDKEFWFNDGTVILVAQDVEFCIYKGILAEHSPVFSDMFWFVSL